MKDKKNNCTKDDCKQNINKAFSNLIDEIKTGADCLSETEFSDLMEQVVPILKEDDTIYGTSIWTKLRIEYELRQSPVEYRSLSVKAAVRKMDAHSVASFTEHIWLLMKVHSILKHGKKGYPINDFQNLDSYIEWVDDSITSFYDWVQEDVFERLVAYENEIKKLEA